MTAHIIRGNALALPLPDASVDLICTSPPYFGLRSYTDNGAHYAGQIGSEATPAEFVAALLAATREMVRVLKPSGSIWVNLGDKYSTSMYSHSSIRNVPQPDGDWSLTGQRGKPNVQANRQDPRVPNKSLLGIPWRYALRCIDELGLILRAEIIWCLSGGARVYARINGKDRPLMLRDLARSYRPESVQLWNGERWTQVLGWNKTPDDDGALELELRTGERIGCTPGHQWPTSRGLLRADQVRVGDIIETTRLPEPEQPRTPALLPDEDIGWLVGLYIAEGSRSGRMIQFAGHINETIRHTRLARIAESLDGSAHVYQTSENGATCNLSGSVIEGVIDRYVSAGTAKTKRLTAAAWQRSTSFLTYVAGGYLSGDGHYDAKNDRWRLGFCANDEWAADLRTLAARIGAKISLRRSSFSGSYGTFPGWRGEWRWTRSAHHNVKPDGQVVAIRASRARDFYDVGVADEPHLFALASGVLTHNSKPNGLPESVTDRVRRSHEVWFHFTREPRYYSAVDEIREPQKEMRTGGNGGVSRDLHTEQLSRKWNPAANEYNPLGKLPGSVWTIPTQPLTVPPELGVDHFAAFPMEWPRRIIQGWSPAGVCTGCGEGRRPVLASERTFDGTPIGPGVGGIFGPERVQSRNKGVGNWHFGVDRVITGYTCGCLDRSDATCPVCRVKLSAGHAGACPVPVLGGPDGWTDPRVPAPTRPAVILDPFSGTGTTVLVAKMLGRTGIGVDMSADYCRLAEWRTTDPGQMAAALQVERPDPVSPDQLDLFSTSTP